MDALANFHEAVCGCISMVACEIGWARFMPGNATQGVRCKVFRLLLVLLLLLGMLGMLLFVLLLRMPIHDSL